MKLNEAGKLLEQFKEKCDNSNLKTLLFVTDRKNALFVGSFNKSDVKTMLIGVLEEMSQSERVEIINAVIKKFIR